MYPSFCATSCATLLFPDPAGPSMAMVSFFMCEILLKQFAGFTLIFVELETHDVVAAIHVNGFAGNSGTRAGQQERGGAADFSRINIAPERSAIGVGFE